MIFAKENIKQVDLDFLVNQKIETSRLNEVLFIVPTNRKIRYFKKELISLLPGKTTSKINIETIGTISVKLLSWNYIFKPLSDAESSVIFKQSVSEAKLKYLSGYKKEIPAGTLERIKNVISEYKRQGISAERIFKDAEGLSSSEKLKAEDIATIYKIYKLKCLQLNSLEIGDVYEKLNETNEQVFRKILSESYPEIDLVVINGFDEFSQPEIDIIDSISNIKGIRLFINFDFFQFNPLIFVHLNNCSEKLIAKKFRITEEKSYNIQNNFIDSVRSNLFQKKVNEKIGKYKDILYVISGADRVREIELVAKQIKELIFNNKAKPHEICISFNLIDKYSPIIRDVFTTYRIPFNLTDRIALSNSYPVTGIINLLEILENDFYYKNIFRALCSGFLDFKNKNLAGLMKAAAELKIVSGYDNWLNTLSDALKNLEDNPETEQFEFEKKKKQFSKAAEDISDLADILAPFARKLSLSEFSENLTSLIYKLNLPKNLIRDLKSREEENIRAVTTFLATIDEIFAMLQLEFGKDEKFPLHFFLEQIRTAVSSARFNVKEKSDYGVQVTSVNEIRGLQFDYLFISGLCDGDFPTRFDPEIFFTGSFAKSESNHQTAERYHFYQALCAWKKGLYLTCPQQEKGKELVQSSFLKDFCSLYEVTEIKENDFENSVYSIRDLQTLIGRYGIDKVKKEYENLAGEINWQAIEYSLKVEEVRKKDPFGESVYNGFLNPPGEPVISDEFRLSDTAKEKLKQLSEKEYSVTQLEQYAKCPYQYFIKRVLNIDIIKEPSEEIEAFELGTLHHLILYKFYSEITGEGVIIKNCSDEDFTSLVDKIFNIAEQEIGSASFSSPFSFYEKEKILGIDGIRKNSILYKFLEEERKDSSESIPEYFELAFGMMKNEEIKNEFSVNELKLGGIKVRGKIDRLELNENKKQFNVVDYKLGGNKPSGNDLHDGLSLQLPLYMYAASQMIKTQLGIEYEPANAFIYSLKYKAGDFGKLSISLRSGKDFEELNEQNQKEVIEYNNELINICTESIRKYVDEIKAGKFNLSLLENREQKVCRYCNFRSICRIQEAQ